MEIRGLLEGRRRSASPPGTECSTHAGAGPGEPVQLLSLPSGGQAGPRWGHGVARCHAAYRAGVASYGRPRLTAELRRQGWTVNPKRVYRLMREDNLLCLRRRKFVITTDSDHGLPVYPNRARELVLTGLDQLWVADITYIRLELEFVYLAVILDAFSRRVLGWALDRTLEAKLTLEALRMTLQQRKPAPGLD